MRRMHRIVVDAMGGDHGPEEVVAGAHERCPYSNATRGNIEVKLTVI